MREIWILRPGFYTEFRAGSLWQSGLAWGAILETYVFWVLFPKTGCHVFGKNKKMVWAQMFPEVQKVTVIKLIWLGIG